MFVQSYLAPAELRVDSNATPRTTNLRDLADAMRSSVRAAAVDEVPRITGNQKRDALLGEYRRRVQEQIDWDLSLALAELRSCVRQVSTAYGREINRAAIRDLFERLEAGAGIVQSLGVYADAPADEKCWVALQQFYLDALDLAEKLNATWSHASLARLDRVPRRWEAADLNASSRWQAYKNMVDLAVARPFSVDLARVVLPSVMLECSHRVNPWKAMRYAEFEDSVLGWTRRGGFQRLRSLSGPAVRIAGLREFLGNRELFDTETGRTRHNVIITAAHRLGFLDIPLIVEVIRSFRHGLWVNTAAYGAGIARKFAQDSLVVPVRGEGSLPAAAAIRATRDLLTIAKVPVVIIADGAMPPLFYGHQMRLKPGLRVAADAAVRASVETGRRTYIIPISLNDPLAFVRGQRDEILVTVHEPIAVDASHTRGHGTSPGGGDDLLNHLEVFFLLNTAHVEYGLASPRVVRTVVNRRRRLAHQGGVRAWLEARFHASIGDLAWDNAADRLSTCDGEYS